MKTAILKNRVALVTGASRGIGVLVARALADQGAEIVLHSRSLDHTASLAAELAAIGVKVHQVAAELSSAQAVEDLIRQVEALVGSPDILYNNAAIMTPYHADWLETRVDEYQVSFMVNTIAPIMLCTRFLPSMLAKGWGRIVNVTSGIADQPELMAYAVSKAALDKHARDTAPKLQGTGVCLNLLDPGWLRTDLGGPEAPGDPSSVLPGALVPVLLSAGKSGVLYRAQDYAGQDTGLLFSGIGSA